MDKLSLINSFMEKGWYIIPLLPNTKTPAISKWKEDCTNDINELIPVSAEYPTLNYGVVTGKKSGLFVIDVDVKNGKNGIDTIIKLGEEIGKLPSTFTVKTPNGGYHYYFNYPPVLLEKLGNKINFAEGLDVRADGAYVACPPSQIEEGKYEVVNDISVADIPDAWINYIYQTNFKFQKSTNAKGDGVIIAIRKEFELPLKIEDGMRSDMLLRYGSHLISKGLSYENIAQEVQRVNENRCTHPLTNEELCNTVFKSLENYHHKYTVEKQMKEKNNVELEKAYDWLIISRNAYNVDENKYAKYYKETIRNNNIFYGGLGFIDYTSTPIDEKEIKNDILQEISQFCRTGTVKKVQAILECLKLNCLYDTNINGKECLNIYSNIKEDTYLKFNYETNKYEIHDNEIKQPRLAAINLPFSQELMNSKEDLCLELSAPYFNKWITDLVDEKEMDILQEYLGYCMTASTEAQMALQLEGAAGIGKSRVYDLLSLLIGEKKISSYDISSLEDEKYLAPIVTNKLVIYDDDIKVQSLKDTGLLKKLITSNKEKMTVRQIYGESFQANVYVKLLMCGNHSLSSLYDKSDGLWRRFILLKCKPLNPNREKILFTTFDKEWRQELPYIFCWCLQGLERLIKNNFVFSHQDVVLKQRDLLKEKNDSVYAFIKHGNIEFTNNNDDMIPKKFLFEWYQKFCSDNDLYSLTPRNFMLDFKKKAESYGVVEEHTTIKSLNFNGRVLRGIKEREEIVKETISIESIEQMKKYKEENGTIIQFNAIGGR